MGASQGQGEETVFRWGIASITFSGGQEIPLDFGSVLILIGPNNSGKSRALREIDESVESPNVERAVISSTSAVREGTQGLFLEWLQENYPSRAAGDGSRRFRTKDGDLPHASVEAVWRSGHTLHGARAFLVHRLGTEDRLTISNRVGSIDPYRDQPQAYIHVLQTNDAFRRKVSEEVASAFGTDVIINWGAGRQVGFHVGRKPPGNNWVSEEYLTELNNLPRLEQEGDGIRSFVGGLLAALCGAHPVLLIDEPEAFLHPPQAHRLSAALARTVESLGRQLIIATHSADVVRGALEESGRVSVCRITRETTPDGDVNNASVLESDQLKQLWARPLLRSSAAIDGLFHEGVVVCEGDADSRFYEALLRRIETQGRLDRAADLYFVHGGGKGQLASLARAYRALKVRTAVVADLDLLRKKDDMANLLAALGSDLAETEGIYNTVHSALSDRPPVTSVKDSLSRMRAILNTVETGDTVSGEKRREILDLLENAAPWSEAKRHGIAKLRGGARQDAEKLLQRWADIGLFLVPAGELECWWPQGPREKSGWFLDAIKKVVEDETSLPEATEFMASVCGWFGYEVT